MKQIKKTAHVDANVPYSVCSSKKMHANRPQNQGEQNVKPYKMLKKPSVKILPLTNLLTGKKMFETTITFVTDCEIKKQSRPSNEAIKMTSMMILITTNAFLILSAMKTITKTSATNKNVKLQIEAQFQKKFSL